MRYAVIHCRNPQCLLKVWVPATKLGARGKCPLCSHTLLAPARVPPDELLEGPPLMEIEENGDRTPQLARTA